MSSDDYYVSRRIFKKRNLIPFEDHWKAKGWLFVVFFYCNIIQHDSNKYLNLSSLVFFVQVQYYFSYCRGYP